ncbi:hypothetical protein EC604_23145 [Paenibacillus amylolyticus]|uniref:Uncharacterized protein n=1 Tax=Paenibacillus amylolyticus TaxID=1451 RepID=A0A5M9WZB3_PAEAM|nr:hypothetical protein [Paenibacillus amylolyticus]KAA8786728.1 hypothetical protein EC604_23145 [Paenibacillus amylolyticus]
MLKQTVLWTAHPNGIIAGHQPKLRLSAVVSPRLMGDAAEPTRPDGTLELQQFPDFLTWPKKNREFSIRFTKGPTLKATVASVNTPRLDLWRDLFPAETSVLPYEFNPDNFHKRQIRSYPVGNILWLIKRFYQDVAQKHPTEHPRFDEERWGYLNDLIPTDQDKVDINNMLRERFALPRESIKDRDDTGQWRKDLVQLQQFYPQRDPFTRVEPRIPTLDFHQVISSLGDYPLLLRELGLVFDLVVDLEAGIPLNGSVAILPSWSSTFDDSIDRCPETQYSIDPTHNSFTATPASSGISEGYVQLVDTQINNVEDVDPYSVIQVDADSTSLKFLEFIRNVAKNQQWDHSTGSALPSFRSNGISIVHGDRARELFLSLNDSVELNADIESGGGLLFAEQLVRGYRVDVWDSESKTWHSLCRREGKYDFGNHRIRLTDEGFISMGLTTAADKTPQDLPDLHLHQSLFTWGGWSLVAPRPGNVIDPQDSVASASNNASTNFQLETHFKPVAGSLPRLRFGRAYRFRMRAVDLAGNSRNWNESLPKSVEDTSQTRELFYNRFEPVESPVVVLRKNTGPGESVHHLIIRSNFNSSAEDYNERHIAPPKVSQMMAEQHGCFDISSGLDPNAYQIMINKDGNFSTEPHEESQLRLPYLPDPISRGAAFLGLPGSRVDKTMMVPFTTEGDWFEALPFRLRLEEGTGKPNWDPHRRLLKVYLPKAETATIQLSSYLSEEDWGLMGIRQIIEEKGPSLPSAATRDYLRRLALEGRLWMLTPSRELTLVHAVRQPLIEPVFQETVANREKSQTYVNLKGSIGMDGKSTVKLDINACWQEPVDALSEPQCITISHQAHVCEIKVDASENEVPLVYRHEFGDTKYRQVTYTADATSRFSEYFHTPYEDWCTLSHSQDVKLRHTHIVENTEIVLSKDKKIKYERKIDYTIDYSSGTITRTTTGAIRKGESVHVLYSYLPGEITRSSESVTLDIFNSAPPAAPSVLYAVPGFEWQREQDMSETKIHRKGGRLRIYLDRPWFSSGEGELLGVILWPDLPGNEIPPQAKPYITQWGKDCIRSGGARALPPLPQLKDFKRATLRDAVNDLQELPGKDIHVAGHTVQYDQDYKRWYCDVDINTYDEYDLFVRLALTRYQPMSLNGAHLSPVVLLDFIQTPSHRLVTFQEDPNDSRKFNISLSGTTPGGPLIGAVVVKLQTMDPHKPEQGWLPVPNFTYYLAPIENPETWTGQITLPSPRGDKPYNLIVCEYERHEVDGDAPNNIEMRLVCSVEYEI